MLNRQTKTRFYDQQISNQGKKLAGERSKKRAGNFFRVLVWLFLIVILLTLIVQIPSLIGKIQKPFPSIQSKFASRGDINTDHRTNILLLSQSAKKLTELGFLSLEKGDRKVKLITINPKAKFNSLQSSGSFSEQALLNTKLDLDRLDASLMLSLGYFFDGYILIQDQSRWVTQTKIEKLIDYFYSPSFFLKLGSNKDYLDHKLKTNISLSTATNLIWFSKSLVPKRVSLIDLSDNLDQQGDFDTTAAASRIGLQLTDTRISNEESSLEIENASKVAGVGNILKNIVTNLGGNVLSVSKTEEAEKSSILVKNVNNLLAKRLETILGVKMEKIKNASSIEGDIKLKVGNDFASYFDF